MFTKDVLSYHGNVRAVHGLVIAFDDQTVTLYNMKICFMSLQQIGDIICVCVLLMAIKRQNLQTKL